MTSKVICGVPMPIKASKTACRKMKRDQDLPLVWETQCQASTQTPKLKGQRSDGASCLHDWAKSVSAKPESCNGTTKL